MSHHLTVNTARPNVNSALVAGVNQPYTPKAFPTLNYGETVDITLTLVTGGGSIDSRSGTAGYTPRVSVMLPSLQPTNGTFTISDSASSRYASTDGIDDAIDLTGFYPYRDVILSFKARAPAGTLIETSMGSVTQTSNNQWQSHQFTYTDDGEPLLLGVGIEYSAADWSDVIAKDATTSEILGMWKLDERNSGNLNGVTVRSDGGTYSTNGVYVGCTGGEGQVINETITADYDITSAELSTLLNAMNDGKGAFNYQCTVTRFANGIFSILFNTAGATPTLEDLILSTAGIQPQSTASVLPISGALNYTRDEQLVKITADPLIQESTATQMLNGWTMTLDADNAKILRATAKEQGAINAKYKIEIVNADSTLDVIAQGPVIIKA